MRNYLLVVFLFTLNSGYCQIDTVNIYINSGTLQTVDSNLLSVKAFNQTSTFKFNSQVFRFKKDQSVYLIINNGDTIKHTVAIENIISKIEIEKQSRKGVLLELYASGAFRIFESSPKSEQAYLGLSGLFVVEETREGHFFWNLKEFYSKFNRDLSMGLSPNFQEYKPDYFLINGLSNPKIDQDTLAKIRGRVGDTIQLYIVNSGNSVHSIHFHGYHCKVIYSSRTNDVIGWVKDTYALFKDEVVQLEIVPDKPGEYPVHDHNLVAITANNIYPKGMFTSMVILQ